MRILAMETSGLSGSVAAMEDGKLLLEMDLDRRQRSAQSLAPAIQTLLQQLNWKPDDVRLVAVTSGPGSFTGLRVGVTTAKTFAYAVGADIVGVNTLAAIAYRAPEGVETLSAAVDAHRGEVVAQQFRRAPTGPMEPAGEPTLIAIDAWLSQLPAGTVLSGPVLRKLADRLPAGLALANPDSWQPTAGAVAHLAAGRHAAGDIDDLWTLAPRYFRRSAAEERADAAGNAAVT